MQSATPSLTNEIVRAGAGAGKTTLLTKRVVEFIESKLQQGGRPPRIVVSTFTIKATQELRERILREACRRGRADLMEYASSKSNLHISTIHGVLTLFLRRYGHLMELDPNFKIMDDTEAVVRTRKLIRRLLLDETEARALLEYFSVEEIVGLVQAVKKSAPTGVPIYPVTENVLRERHAAHIKELCEELGHIAKTILAETQKSEWLDWANAVCEITKRVAQDASASGSVLIIGLSEIKRPRFMSKLPAFPESLNEELKDCLDNINELDSETYNTENFQAFAAQAKCLVDFYRRYNELETADIKRTGQIEMGQLETVTLEKIREFPVVAKVFASEWDYWLIDEYQDTSPTQVQILKHLVGETPAFVVGDPQQSIYLFRGARSEVFAERELDIVASGGEKLILDVNYRSTPALLAFFNSFFSGLSKSFANMRAGKEPIHDINCVAHFHSVEKTAEQPFSPLAEFIIEKIKSGARFDHFCVLARKNSELTEVARFFETLNIPTHLHSSQGFFARREILDCLSILKFLLNPHDNTNLVRLLRSPWLKVSDSEIVEWVKDRPVFYWLTLLKNHSSHKVVIRLAESLAQARVTGVVETLKMAIIDLGLIHFSSVHDPTGRREANIWKFLQLLAVEEKRPGANLMAFVTGALDGYATSDGSEESDAVAAVEPNRVNLMTIHKAKGLKFEHVLIPNIGKKHITSESRGFKNQLLIDEVTGELNVGLRLGEDRKFHHNRVAQDLLAKWAEREEAEHLRLLYVAMTRAVQSVFLHWQSPSEKRSWREAISKTAFRLVETGEFKMPEFTYSFKAGAPVVTPLSLANQAQNQVRQKWLDVSTQVDLKKLWKHISVSKKVEELAQKQEWAAQKPNEINLKTLELPVIGQRIHALLERLRYNADFDVNAHLKTWFGARHNEMAEAVDYVIHLQAPPIQQLLQAGEVEWGFQHLQNGEILEGQIDLWGIRGEELWIVDYKTGSSRYSDKAFTQLELYAKALLDHLSQKAIKSVQLAAVYALEGKTEIREFQGS